MRENLPIAYLLGMGISVVINTYNEAKNLQACLDTLKGFDEIVVCDMESTDETEEIARRNGCKTVIFPKGKHTICEPARNTAIHSASHPWVLVLDADEKITPELRDFLYDFIKNPGNVSALYVARKNYILHRFKKSSYPDYQLRFLMRDRCDWPPVIHSTPKINGLVGKIPANRTDLALIHNNFSMHNVIERMNRYTSVEVEKRLGKKSGSLWRMIAEPWFFFVKTYIFKASFRFGTAGYISAKKDAVARFYLLAKIYEREQDIKRGKRPDKKEKCL